MIDKEVTLGRITFTKRQRKSYERQQWNPSKMSKADRVKCANSLREIADHMAAGEFMVDGQWVSFASASRFPVT